jgi:hypothetical protein
MLVFGYQDSHNVFRQAIDDYLLFARPSEHKSTASTTQFDIASSPRKRHEATQSPKATDPEATSVILLELADSHSDKQIRSSSP